MIRGRLLLFKLSAKVRKLKKKRGTTLKLFLLVKVVGWEFYPSLVKAILRESLYVLIQTCNLHTRQFAFMPAANWFGRKRDKKKRCARISGPKYRSGGTKFRRGSPPAFVVRSRPRWAKTYAYARVYSVAPTTQHPSGIPYEITRRTANTRGKLMRVFNSRAGNEGEIPIVVSAGKLDPYGLAGKTSRGRLPGVLFRGAREYIEADTKVQCDNERASKPLFLPVVIN